MLTTGAVLPRPWTRRALARRARLDPTAAPLALSLRAT